MMKKTVFLTAVMAAALAAVPCAAFAEGGAPQMPYFGIGMIGILFIALLLMIPWLIAVVDIVKSEFRGSDKIVMFLLVVTIPLIGMIIYFTVGRKMKTKA